MKGLSEAAWQRQVIQMARTFGWLVAHFRTALNRRGRWQTAVAADGSGFPDLVLVHERTGDTIFAELKTDTGRVSPEQERWLTALQTGFANDAEALAHANVWRPRDFARVRARLMTHHLGPRRGDDAPAPTGATA